MLGDGVLVCARCNRDGDAMFVSRLDIHRVVADARPGDHLQLRILLKHVAGVGLGAGKAGRAAAEVFPITPAPSSDGRYAGIQPRPRLTQDGQKVARDVPELGGSNHYLRHVALNWRVFGGTASVLRMIVMQPGSVQLSAFRFQ